MASTAPDIWGRVLFTIGARAIRRKITAPQASWFLAHKKTARNHYNYGRSSINGFLTGG